MGLPRPSEQDAGLGLGYGCAPFPDSSLWAFLLLFFWAPGRWTTPASGWIGPLSWCPHPDWGPRGPLLTLTPTWLADQGGGRCWGLSQAVLRSGSPGQPAPEPAGQCGHNLESYRPVWGGSGAQCTAHPGGLPGGDLSLLVVSWQSGRCPLCPSPDGQAGADRCGAWWPGLSPLPQPTGSGCGDHPAGALPRLPQGRWLGAVWAPL